MEYVASFLARGDIPLMVITNQHKAPPTPTPTPPPPPPPYPYPNPSPLMVITNQHKVRVRVQGRGRGRFTVRAMVRVSFPSAPRSLFYSYHYYP